MDLALFPFPCTTMCPPPVFVLFKSRQRRPHNSLTRMAEAYKSFSMARLRGFVSWGEHALHFFFFENALR
jgi:hypothetical protein